MDPGHAAPRSEAAPRRRRLRRPLAGACLALLLPLAPAGAGAGAPAGPGTARAAPSCVDEGDNAGSARGEMSGDLDAALGGEAYFRSARTADGAPALELRLDDPNLGRWQITFTLPGRTTLPSPGDLPVLSADSAAALAGAVRIGGPTDTAAAGDSARAAAEDARLPRIAGGEIYLFDPSSMSGRRLSPESGSISLDAVDDRGICGRFDVTWHGAGGGLREVRTRGTFRAVNAGFGPGDREGGGAERRGGNRGDGHGGKAGDAGLPSLHTHV